RGCLTRFRHPFFIRTAATRELSRTRNSQKVKKTVSPLAYMRSRHAGNGAPTAGSASFVPPVLPPRHMPERSPAAHPFCRGGVRLGQTFCRRAATRRGRGAAAGSHATFVSEGEGQIGRASCRESG